MAPQPLLRTIGFGSRGDPTRAPTHSKLLGELRAMAAATAVADAMAAATPAKTMAAATLAIAEEPRPRHLHLHAQRLVACVYVSAATVLPTALFATMMSVLSVSVSNQALL